MIIEHLLGKLDDFQTEGKTVVKVSLDRDGLSRPHQKVKTSAGETFALSLPHGEHLFPGAVIYEDENRIVAIELAAEDALAILPKTQMEWTRAAYNTGNMHAPAYIQDTCILTPYDAILESVMQRLGIACERRTCPIDGVRAAAAQTPAHHHHGEGHAHGHSHGHTHAHGDGHGHAHGDGESDA